MQPPSNCDRVPGPRKRGALLPALPVIALAAVVAVVAAFEVRKAAGSKAEAGQPRREPRPGVVSDAESVANRPTGGAPGPGPGEGPPGKEARGDAPANAAPDDPAEGPDGRAARHPAPDLAPAATQPDDVPLPRFGLVSDPAPAATQPGPGPLAEFGLVSGGGAVGPHGPVFGGGGNARRIVFVCDAAGSMLGKMATLKDQLLKAIDGLKPVQSFDVIFLLDGKAVALAGDELLPANAGNKRRVARFLDDTPTAAATDPVPGLTLAFARQMGVLVEATEALRDAVRVLRRELFVIGGRAVDCRRRAGRVLERVALHTEG